MPIEITTTDGKKYLVEDHADNATTIAHVRNSTRNQWIRAASPQETWVNREQIVSMCVVELGLDVEQVGFRYTLRLADGTDAGEVEYADTNVQAGDVIRVDGNHRMRVLAVVPVELAGEFVDDALYGVLEVELA